MLNLEIILGGLVGAFFSVLLVFAFRNPNRYKDEYYSHQKKEEFMEKKNSTKSVPTFFGRWSVRLALIGFALGYFAAISQGVSPIRDIGFIIGMGLPMAVVLGLIGFVIDLIKRKKRD